MGIIYLVVWIACMSSAACITIAYAKNKSLRTAAIAGFLLGVFALIYYIFVRSKPEEEPEFMCLERSGSKTGCTVRTSYSDKFCPNCGKKFGAEKMSCPECKTLQNKNVKYCTNCGYKFIKEA
jgi:RNA polymerase subunit RPABC4/transcription elongation factor Spt4